MYNPRNKNRNRTREAWNPLKGNNVLPCTYKRRFLLNFHPFSRITNDERTFLKNRIAQADRFILILGVRRQPVAPSLPPLHNAARGINHFRPKRWPQFTSSRWRNTACQAFPFTPDFSRCDRLCTLFIHRREKIRRGKYRANSWNFPSPPPHPWMFPASWRG